MNVVANFKIYFKDGKYPYMAPRRHYYSDVQMDEVNEEFILKSMGNPKGMEVKDLKVEEYK